MRQAILLVLVLVVVFVIYEVSQPEQETGDDDEDYIDTSTVYFDENNDPSHSSQTPVEDDHYWEQYYESDPEDPNEVDLGEGDDGELVRKSDVWYNCHGDECGYINLNYNFRCEEDEKDPVSGNYFCTKYTPQFMLAGRYMLNTPTEFVCQSKKIDNAPEPSKDCWQVGVEFFDLINQLCYDDTVNFGEYIKIKYITEARADDGEIDVDDFIDFYTIYVRKDAFRVYPAEDPGTIQFNESHLMPVVIENKLNGPMPIYVDIKMKRTLFFTGDEWLLRNYYVRPGTNTFYVDIPTDRLGDMLLTFKIYMKYNDKYTSFNYFDTYYRVVPSRQARQTLLVDDISWTLKNRQEFWTMLFIVFIVFAYNMYRSRKKKKR